MKNSVVFLLLFTVLISLVTSCKKNGQESQVDYTEILSLADSLSVNDLERSDSLYRMVINDRAFENTSYHATALLGLAILKINQNEFDTASVFIENAGKISENLKDTSLLYDYYIAKGSLYHALEYFDKTEECFSSGLRLAELAGNESIRHTFLLNLGQVLIDKGMYAEAMKTFTDELRHSESTGNEDYQSIALQNMANIAAFTDDNREAIRLTKKSLAIQKKLNLMQDYAYQLQNLGIYYKNIGVYDSAIEFNRQAFQILSKSGDTIKMIRVQYNMGNILKNQKKYPEAEKEMNEIIRFCKNKEIFTGQVYALSSLATIYAKTNRMEKGLAAIDTALVIAKKNNLIPLYISLYNVKHTLLADMGRYNEAYQILILQQQFSDSLLSLDKQKEILALKSRYETEKKETENVLLKKNMEVQQSKLWLQMVTIVIGALVFIIVSGIFWMRYRRLQHLRQLVQERNIRLEHQNREKIIELEKKALENNLNEKELEKKGLENELNEGQINKLELESKLNQQEMVYQSLVRAELTHTLRSVHEKLSPIKMKLLRKKDQEEFEQLLTDITRGIQKDPISEFEILFCQLHPAFYENLLERCSLLTKSELQISAMIRLNLSTKDIARLINLSVSTIDTTRYHIRRKFELDPKDNLTVFLMTI
jgi:tetratricopeptide (TPR) repeat protein